MGILIILCFLIPVSLLLLVISGTTKKKIFAKIVAILWGGLIGLLLLALVLKPFHTKMLLDGSDFYGRYIIDRSYFPGKQADWQYDHFKFEIKENDSIFFYVTDGLKIVQTFSGSISTRKPYSSARLALDMDQPTHHILTTDPTIYRDVWDFTLVFNSPKFYNMYFKKGDWKKID